MNALAPMHTVSTFFGVSGAVPLLQGGPIYSDWDSGSAGDRPLRVLLQTQCLSEATDAAATGGDEGGSRDAARNGAAAAAASTPRMT